MESESEQPETLQAPPVVAVVVVYQPGEWFGDTLDALAAQDYPNLRYLFLINEAPAPPRPSAGEAPSADGESAGVASAEITAHITARLPDAFVRSVGGNPGFGPTADEVLRLVEGQNGLFLFCHDDIAPQPDTVRLLVEELYRSNAGVVGPKMVAWDDPDILQSVGFGLDRFGEIDQPIEPGEVDQEQHDGVRDVFVLPTACLLVRADLFRELGGFDPGIDLMGEDVEFCWRVHLSGARVVVAPTAKVRHRSDLVDRRPDLSLINLRERHRLRTVATLTGGARLPGRMFELVLLTLGELVVGIFTGRFRQAWASLRALVGLIPRTGSIIRRRREVADARHVPEREVTGLQERGSARLSSFMRNRDMSTFVGADSAVRRWRDSSSAPAIAWIAVLIALIIGSRGFISTGVPAVGDFLRFPASPRDLFGDYLSGWNPTGVGATSPNPTGWVTLSMLSFVTLFRMGALQVLFLMGLVVIGLVGVWRMAVVFPSTRARLAALITYAATPLVGGAYAIGSLGTLIAYAAIPWVAFTAGRVVGIGTADPRAAGDDLPDGIVPLALEERLRRTAQVGIVLGLAAAFSPVVLVIGEVVIVLLALGSIVAMAPWRTAVGYLGAGVGGGIVALALNLPWFTTWSWSTIVPPPPVGDPGRGLVALAAFEIGPTTFAYAVLALYLPLVAALLLARAWRLTWAVRAGTLVVGFGFLAVLGDRGSLGLRTPEAGMLLVPVAIGLAIAAAAAVASFDLDVRDGSFGWRQPLGLAANAAVLIAAVPGLLSIGSGDWHTPSNPLAPLIQQPLPEAIAADGTVTGDYRVLVLGDARMLPTAAREYRSGISYSIIDDSPVDVTDRSPQPRTDVDDRIVDALDRIADGSTQRAGQLLAPLGIRFIAIPRVDGIVSTNSDQLPLPVGLIDALDAQLDIVTSNRTIITVALYENTAWLPIGSLLTGPTAEASRNAGDEPLVSADLSEATPAFVEVTERRSSTMDLGPGVVHLSVPFDDHWQLTVDGRSIPARPAFGTTTAFDVAEGGRAELRYGTGGSRRLMVALQFVLWAAAIFLALRVTVPAGRQRMIAVDDETLISLDRDDAGPEIDPDDAGAAGIAPLDPGLGMIGTETDEDDS